MSNFFWLNKAQMLRLRPFLPKSHSRPRVDDRRVLSVIIFIIRNGLRWCDAPREYGPTKALYNRWNRWCHKGIFAQILEGLSSKPAVGKIIMMDVCWSDERWNEYQISRHHRYTGSPHKASCRGWPHQ